MLSLIEKIDKMPKTHCYGECPSCKMPLEWLTKIHCERVHKMTKRELLNKHGIEREEDLYATKWKSGRL
jgi:hypothetical protein